MRAEEIEAALVERVNAILEEEYEKKPLETIWLEDQPREDAIACSILRALGELLADSDDGKE